MPHKFLVIRWSGMGDIVMTLPAIRWLKKQFKGCHISYLTDSTFAGILDHSGLVDRIIDEPLGGAHRDVDAMAANIRQVLIESLAGLSEQPLDDLVDARYRRLMGYGQFTERQ